LCTLMWVSGRVRVSRYFSLYLSADGRQEASLRAVVWLALGRSKMGFLRLVDIEQGLIGSAHRR